MASLIKSLFALKKQAETSSRKYANKTVRRSSKGFKARLTEAADRIVFSWPMRETLYRHLSAQVGNGVAVEAALDNFRGRLKRRKRITADKIVGDVARRMRNGKTLAEALSTWIPNEEFSILSSGELGGNIPRALDLLIEAKRRTARVNAALKAALTTPAIYTLAVYGMLWAIGKYVTPGLQQSVPKEHAQGLVYGLYVAGDFANSWWMVVPLAVFVSLIAGIAWSLPRWTGSLRIKAESVFPYSFYRDIQGYTWLMSFTALLRSGKADVEILKLQAGKASPWLKERLRAVWWRMDNGKSLPDALLAKGKNGTPAFAFPNPDIVDDISSMAEFSDFPDRISTLAMQWADEIESKTMALAKRFGFWIEILMYVLMGVLMVAINSMSTQVGNVPGL